MKPLTQLSLNKVMTGLVALIVAMVPFQAFLTVWAASLFGHYTAWRLWSEFILIGLSGLCLVTLMRYKNLRTNLKRQPLVWLILAYIILQLITGLVSYLNHEVSTKALGYGLIVNLRFTIFFIVCLIVASRSGWLKRYWPKLLLIPAALVVAFGLVQHFILPYDFLKHFGYKASTIYPYETINNNLKYVRLTSTLRGANPLGTYLIIIIVATIAIWLKVKDRYWRLIYGVLAIATAIVLFFTYSRSAWLGAALSATLVLLFAISNHKIRRWSLAALIVLVIILGSAALLLRHNTGLQNLVSHTQQHSAIKSTSNGGHLTALKAGLKDVVHEPFGLGPGTAGPASVYNNHPVRIAENYFVQVAQEVGWLGLALFLAINWLVAKALFENKDQPLALILFASLIGITLVNLLSHAWTDDSLSYIWWGLAGITLASTLKTHETNKQT